MLIFLSLNLLLALVAIATEFARTLMMVQQNSYRPERYRRYLQTSGETTSMPKLMALIIVFVSMVTAVPVFIAASLQTLFFIYAIVSQLRKHYKKPLVWTPRARRIFAVMVLLCAAVIVAVALLARSVDDGLYYAATTSLACWFASAVPAIAAVIVLKPVEKQINQGYINDAARILDAMPGLTVIGITGSYGKTSTKHYLHRILSEQFSVCMTPGSFNTTMGVVRTVREYLKPYNQVFICEMGAKQPGDIAEICRLVHPSIGIITAVGPQHLESFKSIENVQKTKFELVDALPADGFAVLNNDFPYIANRAVDNVAAIRYAVKPSAETKFAAGDISYTPSGTDFTVLTPEGELRLHTRLVGECNVSNLLAAVIVALHLGMDRRKIAYAVEQIEQVEHRLIIKRTPGGLTIIDDAFNSNPSGSAMALDVLAAMPSPRVVITPGMIELGDRQFELNREFGEHIVRAADVAIIVGQYNREAILSGIADAPGLQLHVADSFAHAQAILAALNPAPATILYENDLPDTFK